MGLLKKKKEKSLVVAEFYTVEKTKKAIIALRDAGFQDQMEYFSSFPEHSLEDELYKGKKRSPVRMFTLIGALTGITFAFLLTIWTSIDYPLRVSAKPLVSIPAFVIVAFECTILFGAIFTLLSMFHFVRLPNFFRHKAYRPEFSSGTFGVVVESSEDEVGSIVNQLEELGGQKVEAVYVR